jgi:hypothetical protein
MAPAIACSFLEKDLTALSLSFLRTQPPARFVVLEGKSWKRDHLRSLWLVELAFLIVGQMYAENVLLPIRQNAVSSFSLPNSEKQHPPHRRQRLKSQKIAFGHGTTTQAQPR